MAEGTKRTKGTTKCWRLPEDAGRQGRSERNWGWGAALNLEVKEGLRVELLKQSLETLGG